MGSSGERTDFLEAAVRTMLSMILGFALRAGRAFYSDKSDKRESSEKCEVEGVKHARNPNVFKGY